MSINTVVSELTQQQHTVMIKANLNSPCNGRCRTPLPLEPFYQISDEAADLLYNSNRLKFKDLNTTLIYSNVKTIHSTIDGFFNEFHINDKFNTIPKISLIYDKTDIYSLYIIIAFNNKQDLDAFSAKVMSFTKIILSRINNDLNYTLINLTRTDNIIEEQYSEIIKTMETLINDRMEQAVEHFENKAAKNMILEYYYAIYRDNTHVNTKKYSLDLPNGGRYFYSRDIDIYHVYRRNLNADLLKYFDCYFNNEFKNSEYINEQVAQHLKNIFIVV